MILFDVLLGVARFFWALMNLLVDSMLGFGGDDESDFEEAIAPDLEKWDTLGPNFDWQTMEFTVDRLPVERPQFPGEKLKL